MKQLNEDMVRWANEKIKEAKVRPRFGYYRTATGEDGTIKFERPGFFEALGYLLEDMGVRRSAPKQKVDPNLAWLTTKAGSEQFVRFVLKMINGELEKILNKPEVKPSGGKRIVLPEFAWIVQYQIGDPLGLAFDPEELAVARKRADGFIGVKEWHPKMTLEDYYDAKEAGVNYLGAFNEGDKVDCFLLK